MDNLTFDQLPQAISQLSNKLNYIEKLLFEGKKNQLEEDQILTIKQTADFLSLAVPTIYGLVSKNEIPYAKKGKRLYFSKIDLTDWVKSGKNKTRAEIEVEAENYSYKRKRG